MSKRSGGGKNRSSHGSKFRRNWSNKTFWWTGNTQAENGPVRELTYSEVKALEEAKKKGSVQ